MRMVTQPEGPSRFADPLPLRPRVPRDPLAIGRRPDLRATRPQLAPVPAPPKGRRPEGPAPRPPRTLVPGDRPLLDVLALLAMESAAVGVAAWALVAFGVVSG